MTDSPPLPRDARSVVDWLIDGARTEHTPQDVLAELCDRLVAGGLPLHRVAIFVRTLHPTSWAAASSGGAGRRCR
jgi:hypothetical protein